MRPRHTVAVEHACTCDVGTALTFALTCICTPALQAAKRLEDATATSNLVYFSTDVLLDHPKKSLALKWCEDVQQAGHLSQVHVSESAACAYMA